MEDVPSDTEGSAEIKKILEIKMEDRNPEQLKKIYLKYAGANAKQLVGLWQKFSEAVQKTEGSKGKAKVHPETLKTMKLDFRKVPHPSYTRGLSKVCSAPPPCPHVLPEVRG